MIESNTHSKQDVEVSGKSWTICENGPETARYARDLWIKLGVASGFIKECYDDNGVPIIGSKTNRFRTMLEEHGFHFLPSMKRLKKEEIESLIALLESKGGPYKAAMLFHVGFFDHLLKDYFNNKQSDMIKMLRKSWGLSARVILGNIRVLRDNSNEDRVRYTSHRHFDEVKDYCKKLGVLP